MITSLYSDLASPSACSSISLPYPDLFGAEFLSLEANLVTNHSQSIHSGLYTNHGHVELSNVNFCNVTLSYTHPGQNDAVNVQVWLPVGTWNGRLQAIGGAGWQAGLHYAGLQGMAGSIGEGYSTVSTDAGLGSESSPTNWGLLSPGNVNLYLLQNMASVSLNDAAVIGKSITASFYGQPPVYSYFSGCSQGGRQGLMLAQRYPDAFDGIAASAPAIDWGSFFVADYWPLFVMDSLGQYPAPCEIDAITSAAIAHCDGLDGLVDGIISLPDACDFDPMSVVGTTINCTNFEGEIQISSPAANVVNATWSGARRLDNSSIWFGPHKDAVLTASIFGPAMIPTLCSGPGNCTRGDAKFIEDWIKLFVLKDPEADLRSLTHEDFDRIAHASVQIYNSILGTNDPDLSEFRDRGGKIVGYHGLADAIIPSRGSEHYYDAVMAGDPSVHDYYRLFMAPGLSHCFGGLGPYPDGTFDAMREWVENGIAPETLLATSVGATPILQRPLCPYPEKQYYSGSRKGNMTSSDGFYCM